MKKIIALLLLTLSGSDCVAAGTGFGTDVVGIVQRSTLTLTGPITFTNTVTFMSTFTTVVNQSSATFAEKIRVGLVDGTTIHADGYIDLTNRTSDPSPPGRGMIYFDASAAGGAGALKISLDGASFVSISTGSAGGGITSVTSNSSQFSGDGTAGNALTLRSSSATLQGNAFNAAGKLFQADSSGCLLVNGLTDCGGKTSAQIQALACAALPCRVQSSTDQDVYTATGTLAGQWRNARLGTGPL